MRIKPIQSHGAYERIDIIAMVKVSMAYQYCAVLANIHITERGIGQCNRLRRFAGRVLSVAGALKGGFRDVYNELLKYDFTPRDAFMLTVRAKRGLKDTSQTGFPGKAFFDFGS